MQTLMLDGSGPGQPERRQYGPDPPDVDPDRTDVEQGDPSREPSREDDDEADEVVS